MLDSSLSPWGSQAGCSAVSPPQLFWNICQYLKGNILTASWSYISNNHTFPLTWITHNAIGTCNDSNRRQVLTLRVLQVRLKVKNKTTTWGINYRKLFTFPTFAVLHKLICKCYYMLEPRWSKLNAQRQQNISSRFTPSDINMKFTLNISIHIIIWNSFNFW